MLGLVGGRLLSCEARAWRQGRIRDSVLGQVLEMHAQNEGRAADPEMFQWARIKQLEAEKKDLERQVQELKAKAEAIEKREGERRALEEKKHAEEVPAGEKEQGARTILTLQRAFKRFRLRLKWYSVLAEWKDRQPELDPVWHVCNN